MVINFLYQEGKSQNQCFENTLKENSDEKLEVRESNLIHQYRCARCECLSTSEKS